MFVIKNFAFDNTFCAVNITIANVKEKPFVFLVFVGLLIAENPYLAAKVYPNN